MSRYLIYIIEDDANISEIEQFALKSGGFDSACFETGELFRKACERRMPDAVLLDLMLPSEDGLTVLKKLRASGMCMPVITVSAKSSEIDKVKCLDAGADDYITKPFGVMELVARLNAVLRRNHTVSCDTHMLESGIIKLDLDKRAAFVSGKQCELTYKEFELLKLLCENEGKVMTRDIMMDRVWGESFIGESRTVDMHIKTLRQKLLEAGSAIKTVRNVGYMLDWS